ncbi:MAG: hypothetical protein JWP63_1261 [Candidatus Solibacter sp.]|nr:hypothetical protein [Candidatus Solibacter sp.]
MNSVLIPYAHSIRYRTGTPFDTSLPAGEQFICGRESLATCGLIDATSNCVLAGASICARSATASASALPIQRSLMRHSSHQTSLASISRQLYFDIAACCSGIHRGGDRFQPLANESPSTLTENNQSDSPSTQILLVLDALIARYHHIERRILGGLQQVAVLEQVPTACTRFDNRMSFQRLSKPSRNIIVE